MAKKNDAMETALKDAAEEAVNNSLMSEQEQAEVENFSPVFKGEQFTFEILNPVVKDNGFDNDRLMASVAQAIAQNAQYSICSQQVFIDDELTVRKTTGDDGTVRHTPIAINELSPAQQETLANVLDRIENFKEVRAQAEEMWFEYGYQVKRGDTSKLYWKEDAVVMQGIRDRKAGKADDDAKPGKKMDEAKARNLAARLEAARAA